MDTPMQITIYDPETNEKRATYTRLFVPWKLLKVAMRLAKSLHLNPEEMSEEDADMLASLVVEVFGNQFSIEDLNDGADVGEMVTVLNQIISKASGGTANPMTPPGN